MAIKVAILSFYSGEVYRGVEIYVHELSNKLTGLGVDVTVYQNGPKIEGSKYKTVSTNLKIDWEENRGGIYWTKLVAKFTRKVLGKIDNSTNFVVTTNGSLEVLYVRVWTLLHRVKHIAVGQSGLGADDKWNLLMFPDVFVALTNPQKDWAKKFNAHVKVEVIPNGVDLDKFNSKVNSIKVNLPHPIVLSVGALEEGKRLDLIIKAVAKTKASLLLVGRGKLEKDLAKLGEELMPGRFKIMSFPHDEMPNVYAACDLFTYPTVPWESFGIVMLEAMAGGLLVVATNDPIRREIVGDAGLFVDPTNIDEYAGTLEKAMSMWGNKQSLSLRDKPRNQAEKFSWDDIAKKYEKLFLELKER